MGLLSFRVADLKALRLAETTQVPAVMVIAGPNGVGKSTLLFAIKNDGQYSPQTRVLYQGPHRVLRKTSVQRKWLGGPSIRWLFDLMSNVGNIDGYEGLSFQNSARSPDNVDEAGGTIKHTLGKIENRRQTIISELVDRKIGEKADSLDIKSLPDVYEPLRAFIQFLLPHLTFSRIDFKNEDNIRCVWTRKDSATTVELDIDDLSSGEKSIVVLFLPLLEDQVREKLQLLETLVPTAEAPASVPDRVVLIDEPEQHLHPDLQSKILSYMRTVSRNQNVQFVVTTHSPTILDQAYDDELYVLSNPSDQVGENQLRRIASNAERLEALKELAGSTYFLTTGRSIVCIEGEREADPEEPTDLRLLEIMYPRAAAVTLVPTTGKGNVITTVTRLREHVPEETFRIRVRGLVDSDRATEAVVGIESLPVCMIENFLLDAEVLHAYCRTIGLETLPTVTAIETALADIVRGMKQEEITLRVRQKIRGFTVRIGGASVAEVKAKQAAEMERVGQLLPSDAELQSIIQTIETQVDGLIENGKALERFRGKIILKRFYQQHVAPKNISYALFCIEVAKLVGKTTKISPKLDPIFDRLVA